ncbi:MAG: hypothetical protein ACRC1H_09210 [Caldilineaceae bacterium]
MNVHTINRRAHSDKPGDETVTFVSMPAEFDLDAIRNDWASPSRLHIPRHEPASGGWLFVVAVLCVAVAAAGVFL